jgi:prolyl 4-hydroxylase
MLSAASRRWSRRLFRGGARHRCTDGAHQQRLDINLEHAGVSRLHADPPVYVIEDFLPVRMCERICAAAEPLLKPSTVLHMDEEERGSSGIRSGGGRDSSSAYLHHRSLPALLTRAEALLGRPRTFFEFPQVTRYTEGQQYKEHHDAIDTSTASGARMAGHGGQRVCTLLVYLSGCAAGGETHFTRLGLSVAPRVGRALVFFPGFLCGAPDAQLAHSAQPAGGEKWVAQLWVRQHQLHAENKVSPLRPEDRPAVPDRVAGKAGTSATLLRRE